jgi:predicted DNA-binding transcriptional regulator AlpA
VQDPAEASCTGRLRALRREIPLVCPDDEDAQRSDADWRLLLHRVLEMPEAQQLRMQRALSDAVGGRLGQEPERDAKARRRLEAVEAMREAAAYLGLDEGKAPLVEEFKEADRETQLSMRFRAVYAAFENSWELATRCFQELPIPRNAAQRALYREVLRGHGKDLQDPLIGLRMWLEDSPADGAFGPSYYRAWAVEVNERRDRGERRVIEWPTTVRDRLRVSWPYALMVAREETPLEDARRTYREELLASRELLSRALVKVVLDLPPESEEMEDDGFPKPVMWWCGELHWSQSDICAYQEGRRFHGQGERDTRSDYMDAQEVADLIELDRTKLLGRVRHRKPNYYKVPRPAGMTGKSFYWKRAEVKSWLEGFKARDADRRSIVLGRPLRQRGLRRRKRNEPEP